MRIHSNKHESKDKQGKTRKQKQLIFVIQGSILAMAGIVVRIIGMLYRMPLTILSENRETDIIRQPSTCIISSLYILLQHAGGSVEDDICPGWQGEHRNCSRILKAALYLCYGSGRHSGGGSVVWGGLFAQLIKNAFQPVRLKDPGAHHLDHGIWGVLRGYFRGRAPWCQRPYHQILEQIVNAVVSVVAAGILFGVGTSINAAQGQRIIPMLWGCGRHHRHRGRSAHGFSVFICLTASKGRERADGPGGCRGGRRLPPDILCAHPLPCCPLSSAAASTTAPMWWTITCSARGMDKLGYMGGIPLPPTGVCWDSTSCSLIYRWLFPTPFHPL